jgi:hypothetical protein
MEDDTMKGFHVAFTCAALIAISSCGTGRTQVEPPPGRDIIDLLNEKKIEVLTQGSGIQSVNLRIRNLVAEPVTVMLPVGTFFDSGNGEAQSMVATQESSIVLDDRGWHSLSPAVACANRPKNVPGGRDTFTVQRSPHQAELARLMPVLEKSYADYPTRQAAVWIVTDDADFEGLGELVEGTNGTEGSRVIHEAEAAAAMQICDQAGINMTKRAIWRDRARIVRALPASSTVKTWLEQTL